MSQVDDRGPVLSTSTLVSVSVPGAACGVAAGSAAAGGAAAAALAPVHDTVQAMAARPDLPPLRGIVPGLIVPAVGGQWFAAAALVSGEAIEDLLAAAHRRWSASPAAEAALAWKSYSYWAALPALLGYASARRVPLPRPDALAVSIRRSESFVTVGLIAQRLQVSALAGDAVASSAPDHLPGPSLLRVPDESALLRGLRVALMDEHFIPIMEEIRSRVPVGARTLRGSIASGVAHALSRAGAVVAGPTRHTAEAVLEALDLHDLVDVTNAGTGGAGLLVRRRTCCLAFRLPQPKICSDCCLRPPPAAAKIDG
jgi:hypothetical protein